MTLEVQFKEKMNTVCAHLAQPGKQVTGDDVRSLMFGDYMATAESDDRHYDEIEDLSEVRQVRIELYYSTSNFQRRQSLKKPGGIVR